MSSTRLYYGYTIPKFKLNELLNFSKTAQAKLKPIAEELYAKLSTKDLVYKIDDRDVKANGSDILFDKSNKSKNISLSLWLHYIDRIKEMKGNNQRDPEIDFDTYVIYIPIKNKILAWFVSEQQEIINAWESLPEVKDYKYWDSSDRPKEISKKAWDKRLKDWTDAFDGDLYTKVSQNGFKYSFFNDDIIHFPQTDDVLKHTPDFETRLKRVADNDYMDRFMIEGLQRINPDEASKSGTLIHLFNEARMKINSGEVNNEIEELKVKFEPLLTKEFTKEILFNKLKIN